MGPCGKRGEKVKEAIFQREPGQNPVDLLSGGPGKPSWESNIFFRHP
jgi:hypothetical protein